LRRRYILTLLTEDEGIKCIDWIHDRLNDELLFTL